MFSNTLSATKSFILRLAAGLLLAACATVSSGAPSAPAILVVGDSLSAEYGLQRGQGWVALMQQRLKEKHFDYSVTNASISGDTTAGGAARIGVALKNIKPVIVIIELGSNDGLRGLSLDDSRANLESMILASQRAGAKVLLIGMQIPPNYGRDYTEKFKALFPELARKHKVSLAPFLLEGVGEKPELFQADGLHPLAQAHPRILNNVWPGLEPLLKGALPKR
ncbi:MAG: arylesterase [Betaproteobacteria bacterium]|nr:arylesterase [Betaproteobacteria bacterium]